MDWHHTIGLLVILNVYQQSTSHPFASHTGVHAGVSSLELSSRHLPLVSRHTHATPIGLAAHPGQPRSLHYEYDVMNYHMSSMQRSRTMDLEPWTLNHDNDEA